MALALAAIIATFAACSGFAAPRPDDPEVDAVAETPLRSADTGGASQRRPRVLILNAYQPSFEWTQDEIRGIRRAFAEAGLGAEFYIEYMDSKRFTSPRHYERLRELYAAKYAKYRPDLVFVTDDNALTFALEHHHSLWPGAPVVFLGVNFFEPPMLKGHEEFTGVVEMFDVAGTLGIALDLHPGTERVVVVHDDTPTGWATRRRVETAESGLVEDVAFDYIGPGLTMAELKERVASLKPSDVLLYTVHFEDATGAYFDHAESCRQVSEAAAVPMYGLWDHYLGNGIVGGNLCSGVLDGREAGKLGLAILAGKKPADLPVVTRNRCRPRFDHAQIERWGIDEDRLPVGATVAGRPWAFYHEYRTYIWGGVAAGAVQALIIAGLLAAIVRRRRAERALVASERKLEIAVEGSQAGIWAMEFDPARPNELPEEADVSPRVKAMIGYGPDEFPDSVSAWLDLVPDDDRQRLLAQVEEHMRGEAERLQVEYRVRHRDGSLRWINTIGKIQRDAAGNPVRWVGLDWDVTEQRQAQEALAESERKYRALVEGSRDGYAVTMLDGRIVDSNRVFRKMLGYSPEELAELSYEDITPAEYHAEEERIIEEQVLARGYSDVYEKEYIRKSGARIPIEIRTYLVRDKEGKPSRMWAFARDITARKRAQQALRRERDFANRLIENAHAVVTVLDIEGNVLRLNEFGQELTGYGEDELLGRKWSETLIPPGSRAKTEEHLATLRRGVPLDGSDNLVRTKDGRDLVIRWYGAPIRDAGGNVTSTLGIGHDVTELREKEAQLRQARKMEAVGRLAGGVAHDFNNQLTVIRGYAEMALEDLEDGHETTEALEAIVKAADDAARLTSQLLAFSRKQMLQPRPVDLNQVLAEMVDPLSRMLGERIELHFNPAEDLGTVETDPVQFQQAVMNLALNARDAMPEDGRLTIETANAELGPDYARQHPGAPTEPCVAVAVSDTGVGMDRRTRDQVFEPFFTTKPVGEGTGLGLAMVYGFVKQSGGHVNLYSEPGQGTVVWIYLPRVDAEAEPAPEQVRTGPAPRAERGATVLVVEDEDPVRQLIVSVLKRSGHTALEAASPAEALPMAEEYEGPIDLLVTDMVMPGMSGAELAKKLLEDHPDLPVLFTSGYAESDLLKSASLDAEAVLLTKPFTPTALLERVEALLEE